MNFRIFYPDTLFNLLKLATIPTAVIYIFCMLVWPWVSGGGNWNYVQDVWDRWQSLNVGMLAFVSSVTALNISKYNAKKQQQRDFQASKAFLPEALSDLSSYLRDSAKIYKLIWASNPETKLILTPTKLPHEYKSVFAECIRHAEPRIGDYLARILVWLQIHDARLRSLIEEGEKDGYFNIEKRNLIDYLYRLGELKALVDNIFEFARGLEEFDDSPLAWKNFRNAYGMLKVPVDEISIDEVMNLEAFTKRAITRNNNHNA